jgi:exonuclease III
MFNEIMKNIASYSNTSYLLCGDWNVVQDTSIDTYNIIHNRNQNSREKIEEIPLLARLAEKVKVIAEWSVLYPGIICVFFISEKRSSDTRK